MKIKVIEVGKDIKDATVAAISSPLLKSSIEKARTIIFDVCGNSSLSLQEVNSAAQIIYQRTNPDAEINFGATIDEQLHGEVKITIIATNFTA
ncbi:cell division protein FtsZ [Calothrix parasitica NIES-267]|uniref:Cell division protein FtsZ n=1 Tax=Calothrix parasitica NIES-267 TaxID=1973488 RepID=A0A1Z4LJR1_9CYAN|nr:cell division protein FtsZ [Calothrix parasitica NIES-267]